MPFCSFIIPIVLKHAKSLHLDGKRLSWPLIVHDASVIVFTLTMCLMGTYNSIIADLN